jgi:uncharacterized protein YabE (DUF348 family)
MDQHPAMAKRRCLLAAVMALACVFSANASAEVRVEGDLTALRVTTSGDTLSDVLSAFGRRHHVKYRTAVPLDLEINGAYSGSFSQVVSRLLDGYNYVIKKDRDLTEIIVFGNRGEVAMPPKVPVAKGALSRWR